MNIKKLFAVLAGVSMLAVQLIPSGAIAATYSAELEGAYDWAYSKGVTTMPSIDSANMYGAITRAEMAKMLSVYAVEVLGLSADEARACSFTDIDSVKGDLHDYIIKSCKLGIMGQGITAFRPYDTLSRAEFGTALSRVLWGSKYDGATPYYVNHLNALKAAGIMNQIANAESTKEVRGYVMLMLQRSETLGGGSSSSTTNCNDPVVKVACSMDTDACPAACKNAENEENTVVKAGDLVVTAKAAENSKIVLPGTSDLDTLTFKTSEKVEISKVVLERYGYSDANDVDSVWLEDEDGNVIADSRNLVKDKATLTIKKDYRTVDGTFKAIIVVLTTGSKASGSIGFKVADVTSTAENVNLGDYAANTYDIVTYSGANVTVDIKGKTRTYNYEEGSSYEVSRFQVNSNGAAISVKGVTLSNDGNLDVKDFLDDVTVTVDGKAVSGLKWSVNKDDQLALSFNTVEVEMNKRATFIVNASFKDLDEYNKDIAYYLDSKTDFNATEKKTGARVTVSGTFVGKANATVRYTFNGGKIKLSNAKLSKVEASQSATDVLVAEGSITVAEPISKVGFTVTASSTGVEALRMIVAGDEFEGKRTESGASAVFAFSNVEIAESGKVRFLVDIANDDNLSGTINITPNFGKAAFAGARYDNAREDVLTGDVAGTISFVQVTITAAKATLKNNLTKEVEFINNETNTKVVFDGTYTAKKAPVTLNTFYMSGANSLSNSGVAITYHLFIDGDEVADTDLYGSGNAYTFSDVEVEAGKSVNVKVEAEIEAYGSTGDVKDVQLYLGGKDEFNKDIQEAHAKLMTMKVKESGSATISAGASANTVLRKSSNAKLAEFYVKPSNGEEGLTLDELSITVAGTGAAIAKVEVLFDGSEEDAASTAGTTGATYKPVIDLPADGIKVEVNLTEEFTGAIELSVTSLNNKKQSRTFSKRYEEALVFIQKQENKGDETVFTIDIDADSDTTVSNLVLTDSTAITGGVAGEFNEGKEVRFINNNTQARYITNIAYDYELSNGTTGHVSVDKATYDDYFKVGSDYAKVFKATD